MLTTSIPTTADRSVVVVTEILFDPGTTPWKNVLQRRKEISHAEDAHVSIGVSCCGRLPRIVIATTAHLRRPDTCLCKEKFLPLVEFRTAVEAQRKLKRNRGTVLLTPNPDYTIKITIATR